MAEAALDFASWSTSDSFNEELQTALREWVHTHFGMSFTGDQRELFRSRIESFCTTQRMTLQGVLDRLLQGDRALTLRLAEAVSTNHTFFFREPELFEFLKGTILPALPTGARVWSAAASSGDEAYSIAMTAHEHYGDAAYSLVRILGTDISERQLRTAEQGLCSVFQLETLSAARRARWLTAVGLGQFEIKRELRQMCTFRRMNLTTPPWPFEQRFHVIFLRNVLYYFEPSTRRRIIEACFDVTEPGGWLITSLTEPMIDLKTRWIQVAPAIFRRELP